MEINVIDLEFLGMPETIASFLIETSVGPLLVESGPYSTVQQLTKALQTYGYKLADIQHVFLTHIHLDHAGAAWKIAETGATIYVHPKGAKHLANPERLWKSAKQIYKDQMEILWGEMQPIPEKQIYSLQDKETIQIGDANIVAHYSPGHAVHHIAYQVGKNLFTGDAGGIRIGSTSVLPPCPPPDINLEDWLQTIETLKDIGINYLYPTHFGRHMASQMHWENLKEELHIWADWIKARLPCDDLETLVPEFMQFTQDRQRYNGTNEATIKKNELANPSWMSVHGLARYWKKKEI